MSDFWFDFIATIIKIAVIYFVLLNMGGLLPWVERKQAALIQDRVGANRAGKEWNLPGPLALLNPVVHALARLGLIQQLADGGKFFFKEDFIPDAANRFMHTLAPIMAVMPAFIVVAVVPFGPDITVLGRVVPLQIAQIDGGLLFVFALSSLGVYAATIGGWASNNKYSLLGSIRASAQMISYEVAMGLAILGSFMVYETLRLEEMVRIQGDLLFGFLPKWGIFLKPIGFFLFFAAAIAETKRVPFDTPEGESEIVAGYFLEYSGMKFGVFFMAEFLEIFMVAMIISTVFFGGWQVPYMTDTGFLFPGRWELSFVPLLGEGLTGALTTTLRVLSFFTKALFFSWLQIQLRWTVPRFRFDQVLALGWKILLPLSLLNVLATAILLVLLG